LLRVQVVWAQSHLTRAADLILHKWAKWSDHEGQTTENERGHLIVDALASSGREHTKSISPT
jgi:hypothetical protein